MIKKYPWHLVYLIFVLLCLTNIFQKLKWSVPTDNIHWESTSEGLVCRESPPLSPIKKGDILLTVNNYPITTTMDLARALKNRTYQAYEIEREGIAKLVGVDIYARYTPFSYYILVFSGLLFIILTLQILNTTLKKKEGFSPPIYFYLMSLSFSGFLIFSPTGSYNVTDFIYLGLDRLCYTFFPAFLLHYLLYFPIKLKIARTLKTRMVRFAIYFPPVVLFIVSMIYILPRMLKPDMAVLIPTLNRIRHISFLYFNIYLILAIIFVLLSNLWLIIKRKEKRYLFPLIGVCTGLPAMLISNSVTWSGRGSTPAISNASAFFLIFLPVGLTFFLSHRKFSDIEIAIKKTIATASIFVFIFGAFFSLGSTMEQNKILGIFWSVAVILTAGLLYRPLEETVLKYFDKVFFRGAADFKRILNELIQSFRNERNLSLIASNFLNTINNGFLLQKSSFIVHNRKNLFFSLPGKRKIVLSDRFINDLTRNDNIVFFKADDFERRHPRDFKLFKEINFLQFLPLKSQGKLIGVVALGPKADNTYLTVEDWDILFNISSALTLSVENASLYSELETRLNEIGLLKEFNENIIKNINIGIVVMTRLNIIKTWNEFMSKKFRITPDTAVGTKAHMIFDHSLWKDIFKKKHGVSSIHNVKVDIEEEEFIFDIHISPLKDNFGKEIGTILVFEDVTEKVAMQTQLLTSEKMASLGLLSAGIAHEVNTPLTGISSYCQFILDNPGDPENIDLTLKIQEQVQRANKIIRTLLDFSRQKGEAPTELDLNHLINGSIALVEHRFKKKNIQLKKEFDFQNKIYGFSTRLQQMFINLLINAADAVADDGGSISIIGTETDTDLTIRIKDNGKGIDPKHIKRIFDPFFTTKDMGEGTGLGLSITYAIVQEHYGDIIVNSKLNKGTTFMITLPIESPLRSIKI